MEVTKVTTIGVVILFSIAKAALLVFEILANLFWYLLFFNSLKMKVDLKKLSDRDLRQLSKSCYKD